MLLIRTHINTILDVETCGANTKVFIPICYYE